MATGPYYFAWADYGEAFNPVTHARWDDDIFEYELAQAEGDFATLRFVVRNPRIGLLAPGRKRWGWFSRRNASDVIVPLFYGRLVGVPENIQDETVEISFIARPEDFQQQKDAIADEERTYGKFDALWFDESNGPDADNILEHLTKLWHIDRTSLEVTLSDIVNGEDGTLAFGADRVFYDSLQIKYSQNPARRVNMTANVSWDQSGTGSVDLTSKIYDAFNKTYPAGFGGGAIATRSGQGLEQSWPKTGGTIGGGWVWQQAEFNVVSGKFDSSIIGEWKVDPNNSSSSFYIDGGFDTALGTFGVQLPGQPIGWAYHVVIPLWRATCTMIAAFDATRRMQEQLLFTLEADVQPTLTEPDDQETIELTMSSSEVVNQGRIAATARTFFAAPVGVPSIEYLIMVARAHLIARARCVEVSFDIPLDDAIDQNVTLRKSAVLNEPRLPGQFASGKITSYNFTLRDGKENANVTLSATVGRDGTVSATTGTPDYVEEGVINPDGQTYSGAFLVPSVGDVAYESILGKAPNDDGIDLAHMTADKAVKSVVVTGNDHVDNQQAALALFDIQVDETGSVTATQTTFAQVALTMLNLKGGPFQTIFAVNTTQLKIPKLIDLEATAYE